MKKILLIGFLVVFLSGQCWADSDNNYTNEEKAKLSAIAAGAEVNPDLVSQIDAEAGTSETEYSWNPLRIFQSIAAYISTNAGSLFTVDDAPSDGTGYVRKDGSWAGETGGSVNNNITYVPIAGDIQTYVTAATAGDTLILASGTYTITSTITVDKQLNIVGQGNNSFFETPITDAHGTSITCSTASVDAFTITSSDVSLSKLSFNMTGAGNTVASVSNNLTGFVMQDVDMVLNSSGNLGGCTFSGTSATFRNVSCSVISSDGDPKGLTISNNASTTIDIVVDVFNVSCTTTGGGSSSVPLYIVNANDANAVTVNLRDSMFTSLSGTAIDSALYAQSTVTNTIVLNAYSCTFNGDDYDIYHSGSNTINLWDCILATDVTSGTITYAGKVVADAIEANTYGSDDSVSDAELLRINSLTSNAQDQIDAFSGSISMGAWGASSEVTISSGVAALSSEGYYTIDTESDAASDDLTQITGLTDGDEIIIAAEHTDRTVVVKNGTYFYIGEDFTLNNARDRLTLQCIGSNICVQKSRSSGGD